MKLRTALISAVAAVVFVTAPVSALNHGLSYWGSNQPAYQTPAAPCSISETSECVARSISIPIVYDSTLSSVLRAAMTNAIDYYYANTPMAPYISTLGPTYVTTVEGLSVPNDTHWAWTKCRSDSNYQGSDPYVSCVGSYLIWNTYWQSTYFSTQTQQRKLSCHEVGHLAGLRHSADSASCMTPIATNSTTLRIDADDMWNLNAHY
jgi:hypothetical protein